MVRLHANDPLIFTPGLRWKTGRGINQRGSGIFGTLFRGLGQIAKTLIKSPIVQTSVKSAGKSMGRHAGRFVSDVIAGDTPSSAFERRLKFARREVGEALNKKLARLDGAPPSKKSKKVKRRKIAYRTKRDLFSN